MILELDLKKIIVISLFSFSLLYSDCQFLLKKQFSSLKKNNQKIITLQRQIDALSRELDAMQRARTQAAQEAVVLEKKIIIAEDKIPSLLERISSIANKHAVKVMQMTPFKEQPDQVSTGNPALTPLLINMDLSSDYHHFGSFVNELENSEQYIAVQDIKIGLSSNDALRQNILLVLKTYVKK